MRMILLAAAAALVSGPVLAQTTPPAGTPTGTSTGTSTGQRPIDVGPNTPAANGSYQGGGVVLQGAPGAPAPQPQPTPPGKTPSNAVSK